MLALFLALQIAVPPATGPVAPPAASAPAAAAPAKPSAEEPPEKPLAERIADLKVLWTQTCGNRAYGAYDDLCQNLGDQIRQAERDARKAKARSAPPVARPAVTAPSVTAPSVTAQAAPPPPH